MYVIANRSNTQAFKRGTGTQQSWGHKALRRTWVGRTMSLAWVVVHQHRGFARAYKDSRAAHLQLGFLRLHVHVPWLVLLSFVLLSYGQALSQKPSRRFSQQAQLKRYTKVSRCGSGVAEPVPTELAAQ